MSNASYKHNTIRLEQCSLEKRRIVHDLVLMYKFICRLVVVQMSNFLHYEMILFLLEVTHRLYKVLLNANRVNVRRHYFTKRIAPVWNSLSPVVVDFRSLPLFKKTIYAAHVNLFTRY